MLKLHSSNFSSLFQFCTFLFVAPFESNQAGGFFSSDMGRSFGMNASPEAALSPSISSVATSASEVSPSVYHFGGLLNSYYIELQWVYVGNIFNLDNY